MYVFRPRYLIVEYYGGNGEKDSYQIIKLFFLSITRIFDANGSRGKFQV